MVTSVALRGLIIGFSIAAPVGPIGVLCIRRTLANGRALGFVSGLGAATADASYGAVAAFGLTFISSLLIDQRLWLHLIGGLFLCYLGLKTLRAQPAQEAAAVAGRRGLFGAYASTVLLTLTNPTTILSFVAIFAGIGVSNTRNDYGSAGILVLGVFLGSALWWLILSTAAAALRAKVNASAMRWINVGSGLIILGFGLVTLLSLKG